VKGNISWQVSDDDVIQPREKRNETRHRARAPASGLSTSRAIEKPVRLSSAQVRRRPGWGHDVQLIVRGDRAWGFAWSQRDTAWYLALSRRRRSRVGTETLNSVSELE